MENKRGKTAPFWNTPRIRERMIPVLKRVLCLFLAAALLCLAGCGAKQETLSWQEQYDLGVRYLSEGKYEEAVLAFEAAIKIDPRRPEAYASLADAYLAAGDEVAAKDALDRGFAATGDEGLQNHLEGTGSAGEDAEGALFQGPYLVPEDVEFLGMTLEDASALALADGVYDADDAEDTEHEHDQPEHAAECLKHYADGGNDRQHAEDDLPDNDDEKNGERLISMKTCKVIIGIHDKRQKKQDPENICERTD